MSQRQSPLGMAAAGFVAGSALTWMLIGLTKPNTKSESATTTGTTTPPDERGSHEETIVRSLHERTLPASIRTEQLSRNSLYFGEGGTSSIESSSVLVVGLGGVGSHCAHMLARGGVGYLRLVDFDQVTLSSLNRHACAVLEDVGVPKVVATKRFLERICPDRKMLDVDARVRIYTGDKSEDGDLMDWHRGWDVVIDAIDDVPTKARLLRHCVLNNIRVISCMGAGGKADVTRLHISNLRTASRDPLASKLRQTLKRITKNDPSLADQTFLDDAEKIAVVYSSEKTVVKLADFTDEQKEEGVHKFGAVDNMRIRVMPVLGTMPAIMGQSLAAMALCEIGGKPFSPMGGERIGRNVRNRFFQHLKNRERTLRNTLEQRTVNRPPHTPPTTTTTQTPITTTTTTATTTESTTDTTTPSPDWQRHEPVRPPATLPDKTWVGPPQIDTDDVEYLLSEVWRNRCCVTGETLGTVLELCRWDNERPSDCRNLVVVGARALKRFDEVFAAEGDGRGSVEREVRERIERRLESCRVDSRA